ncbi:MAG TPA: MurR/RpiR family transcriptional regulator [Bauldia sp.]|nr:MurR/RpiR family transcriptional regulator [Bauldia sp.]
MTEPSLHAGTMLPDRDVIEIIRERLPKLRKSERKVAEVVLADPDAAMNSTVAILARSAGVSDPTVIRFCEGIGCDGFHDFKIALARGRAFAMHAHSVIGAKDAPADVAGKIFQYTIASLDRARRKLDPAEVAKAIEILAGARKIDFFGFGASAIVALDAQQKFPLFGKPCIATIDSHQQYMAVLTMEPEDVLVAISNTGETEAILQCVEAARLRGAKVIGITGQKGSTLARYCDAVLVVETHENTNVYTPTTSRLGALVIVDILSTGLALRLDQGHAQRFAEMKHELARMRGSLESKTRKGPPIQ